VAIAALLFQAEQNREPASLQELVPRYLPAVPANPCDGTPIIYGHGWVQTGFTQNCPGFGWYLRRD